MSPQSRGGRDEDDHPGETGIVQLDTTLKEKLELITRGREAAAAFLAGWTDDDGRHEAGTYPIPS